MLVPLVSILVLAAVGAACGSSDHEPSDLVDAQVGRRMTIEMRDIAFEPKRMAMPRGEVIELTARNNGAVVHDFTIDKMDADVMQMMSGGGDEGHTMDTPSRAMHIAVGAGRQAVMRMRIHQSGEYQYYCTVAGHREAGMTGVLVVE